VVGDAGLRGALARNAAAVAREEFSIERNVARAEALYESLITGQPASPAGTHSMPVAGTLRRSR
jgi:hypothetical protein